MNSLHLAKVLEFTSYSHPPLYHTAIRYATGVCITSPITSLLCESGLQLFDHIITDKIVAAAGRMMEKNIKAYALIQRSNADFTTLTEQTLFSVTKLIQIGSRPRYYHPPQINWTIKHRGVYITVHHILTECHGFTAERIICKLDHSINTILSPDSDCQR